MIKWVYLLLLASWMWGCSSAEKDPIVVEAEEVIRIYADSIGWSGKEACTIRYRGEEYTGGVKFRGGVSSKYPKHSMTLELDGKVGFNGLPADDDWILNASYIDKTFQRHKLSYDIFRMMSNDNKAPKCTYLPVYLNDNYIGLYVVMEKVNGSWLGFDKSEPNGARLYKDPFVFVEERLPNVQEPDNYYQQKFPKVDDVDHNDELDAFKAFLFESTDDEFLASYQEWVDERSLIDWHLLLLLTNNDDGIFKNFYLAVLPSTGKLEFIPWDYDHSFGRDGNYELNLIDREVGWEKVVILRRLMELNASSYPAKLKERYQNLRSRVFTEEQILSLIAENEEEIRPHLEANAAAWPLDASWYLDANDYDAEIEIIKQYIPMRLEQLDRFFSNLDYGEEEKD